ncbi:hypothetical protein FQR65_LT09398 [Abscondita terminalis]|nr:hypothetical protein FQR65_LT09398 [Abscondita terminalis]
MRKLQAVWKQVKDRKVISRQEGKGLFMEGKDIPRLNLTNPLKRTFVNEFIGGIETHSDEKSLPPKTTFYGAYLSNDRFMNDNASNEKSLSSYTNLHRNFFFKQP